MPLIELIKELINIDLVKTADLVSRMQLQGDHNYLIKIDEFCQIISYLKNNIKLEDLVLGEHSGLVFDKKVTNLARSFVLLNNSNIGKLVILNNRKYYDSQQQITTKYNHKDKRVVLGYGGSKKAKLSICVTLDSNRSLTVNKAVRLSYLLWNLDNVADHQIQEVAKQLPVATNTAQIWGSINQLEKTTSGLSVKYYTVLQELRNSQKFANEPDFSTVEASNPIIKTDKRGKKFLTMYLFDFNLAAYTLSNAQRSLITNHRTYDVENIVRRMVYLNDLERKKIVESYINRRIPDLLKTFGIKLLEMVKKMHAQGIIHADIKANNIVASEDYSLRMIDFGSAINTMSIRQNTVVLLTKLGYEGGSSNGFVDGQILRANDIFSFYRVLGQDPQSVVKLQQLSKTNIKDLTYNNFISKIQQIVPGFVIRFEGMLTSITHASPEVFHACRYNYEKEEDLYLGSYIAERIYENNTIYVQAVDSRYDLWSVGITIFEILFGRYPLMDAREIAIIMKNPILIGILHPDIEHRFQKVDEIIKKLAETNEIIIPQNQNEIDYLFKEYHQLINNLKQKLLQKLFSRKIHDINSLCLKLSDINDTTISSITPALALEKQTVTNKLTKVLEQLIKLDIMDINNPVFIYPGLPTDFLCEFIGNDANKVKDIFAKAELNVISSHIYKYFNFLSKQNDPEILSNGVSQIYHMIVDNQRISIEEKNNLMISLVFSLVEGELEVNEFYKLLLVAKIIEFFNCTDIIFNDRSLLQVLLMYKKPLSQECQQNYYQLCEFLIRRGADVFIKKLKCFSPFEILLSQNSMFSDEVSRERLVAIMLESNAGDIKIVNLESGLWLAVVNHASQNIIRLIVNEIFKVNPLWSNYHLDGTLPVSIWQQCLNLYNNQNLAHYIKALKEIFNVNVYVILKNIFDSINAPAVGVFSRVVLFEKCLLEALQIETDKPFNFFDSLAQYPEVCLLVNACPVVTRQYLSDYNFENALHTHLTPNQIIKLCFGEKDDDLSPILRARENKNLAFMMFLLREFMFFLPINNEAAGKIKDILLEMKILNIDMTAVIHLLTKIATSVIPEIIPETHIFIAQLLQEINGETSRCTEVIFSMSNHALSINTNVKSLENKPHFGNGADSPPNPNVNHFSVQSTKLYI